MTEKLTEIWLPDGEFGLCGYAEWGDQDAAFMVAVVRQRADRMRRAVADIDAAADEDFRIEQGRGVHRRRDVRVIQEGRPRKRDQAA